MVRARLAGDESIRKKSISARVGGTPTVSSERRRRKVRSSLSGVRWMRSTLSSGQRAPSLIQRVRRAASSGVTGWPLGGMTSSESLVVMRWRRALFSGDPGVMAGPSNSPPSRAEASEERLSSPLVFLPWWQEKHFCSRRGWMER